MSPRTRTPPSRPPPTSKFWRCTVPTCRSSTTPMWRSRTSGRRTTGTATVAVYSMCAPARCWGSPTCFPERRLIRQSRRGGASGARRATPCSRRPACSSPARGRRWRHLRSTRRASRWATRRACRRCALPCPVADTIPRSRRWSSPAAACRCPAGGLPPSRNCRSNRAIVKRGATGRTQCSPSRSATRTPGRCACATVHRTPVVWPGYRRPSSA